MAELIDKNHICFRCSYGGECMADIEDCKICIHYVCDYEDIQNLPTTTEAEIRATAEHTYENCHNLTCRRKCRKDGYNMAIDEFAEKLKESLLNNYRHFITTDTDGFEWLTTDAVTTHIEKVAEQLKEE